ncbi:MAG: carboxylate-amine ligase [Myxococcota bacterium]
MEPLTIGIEEEYQLIHEDTRELTSYIGEFLKKGAVVFRDQVKPEFLQSQVEVGSEVCKNIQEARDEMRRLRSMVYDIARANNRKIVAAGTHPFSRWQDQIVTDHERYHGLVSNMRMVARRLLIFGMHVHVGISDRNLQIDIMNQMRYFMPHVLALSTSSPFWWGNDTGLKSYRSIIFEDLPRTGLPPHFQSSMEYDEFCQTLIQTGCIEEPSKIWWDIRPHPTFPTLEFRVCDCTTRVEDAISIAALLQALVATLINLRMKNQTWRIYRRELIAENKWRAVKDGIRGKMLDLGKHQELPTQDLLGEIFNFVEEAADRLGTLKEIDHLRKIVEQGTSADRQLRCYQETDDLSKVVDMLAEHTMEDC